MLGFSTRSRAPHGKDIFYGWWIAVAGAVVNAYAAGTFYYGFSAFFDPIVNQFGWSRALTAGAVSLQRTETGVLSPFVGILIDKFGPRKMMLAGVSITGLGFLFLSQISTLWQFYAAFAFITLGLSIGGFQVVVTSVANWFVVRRGRALALMSAGSGIGGALVPLVILLIGVTDWRMGLLLIGLGFWAVGIPVALVMRSRPEDYGYLPDGRSPHQDSLHNNLEMGSAQVRSRSERRTTPGKPFYGEPTFTARQALATRTFWQLSLALGGGQLIMSSSVHQIPAMTSFGISRETAGLVIMAVLLISLIGRIGSGFLGDVIDKRQVIALAFTFQLIGTLIFANVSSWWHLFGFIFFWGIGFGASIPIRFALLADYFGRRHFGSIMGFILTASTIFGFIGPVFVGWMCDVRGNYREPYMILSLTLLVSIPLMLTLTRPIQRRKKPT